MLMNMPDGGERGMERFGDGRDDDSDDSDRAEVDDLLAVHEFSAGAMENWGLVTYRTTAVLFDEKTSEPRYRNRVAYVVAHELAHQWFGNLVTMDWWDELWLSEFHPIPLSFGFYSHMSNANCFFSQR